MSYEVTAGLPVINFDPQTVVDEVLQNVATIISTPRFTVPMDRNFGVDFTFLDKPMPVAIARASAAIIEAVQEREPRAVIREVTFTGDGQEGILRPLVKVDISDE